MGGAPRIISLVFIAGGARRLFVLVFAFDRLVVLESAELAIGPGDDLLAFVQTALDLDVVVAGDPGLDRGEDRLVVLDGEDAFDRLLFLRVLILILRRRRRRLRAGTRFDLVGIAFDQGLKRNRDDVLAAVGADRRRRRHARTQAVANIITHIHEANGDFEILRLLRTGRGGLGDRLARPGLGLLGDLDDLAL